MRTLRTRVVGWLAVALTVSAVGGYQRIKRWVKPPLAPATVFQTADGEDLSLRDDARATVVGFVIEPCGYSDRVLEALQAVREQHSEDEVSVLAFYLNPTSDPALQQLRKVKGLTYPLAAAQQTPNLVHTLHQVFDIHGAGVDVYVIQRATGKLSHIDYSKKGPSAQLLAEVEGQLARAL